MATKNTKRHKKQRGTKSRQQEIQAGGEDEPARPSLQLLLLFLCLVVFFVAIPLRGFWSEAHLLSHVTDLVTIRLVLVDLAQEQRGAAAQRESAVGRVHLALQLRDRL